MKKWAVTYFSPHYFILLLLLLVFHFSFTQDCLWAFNLGGTGEDECLDITTDSADNIYAIGYFYENGDFNPGLDVNELTGPGENIFISKTTSNGNFIWAKNLFSDSGDENRAQAIVADAYGNIYVTGYFTGNIDFNPGPDTFQLSSEGASDIFILKLDTAGNFLWAKTFGSAAYDTGNGIVLGADGNIFITGNFWSTIDFDPGPEIFNMTSAGATDFFLLNLSPSGDFISALRLGGEGDDMSTAICIDKTGNIYITGNFTKACDFDPSADEYVLYSAGSFDVFILMLDVENHFVFAKAIGGTGWDISSAIKADQSGVFLTGGFSSNVDFDPEEGIFNLASNGDWDIFVLKLNGSGDFLWAHSAGSEFDDLGKDVIIDNAGDVYITGYFRLTVDFGADTLILNAPVANAFIWKLDNDGDVLWVKDFGGTNWTQSNCESFDNSYNLITAGIFELLTDFEPDTAFLNISAFGSWDAFVSKIHNCTPLIILPPNSQTVLINSGVEFTVSASGIADSLQWQVNDGFGFFNLADAGIYSGTSSDTLKINSVSLANSNYKYRCVGYGNSCTDTSLFATLTVLDSIGEEVADYNQNQLIIYPNPASNQLLISLKRFSPAYCGCSGVTITYLSGKSIYESTINSDITIIDVAEFASGFYFIQVNCGDEIMKQKFIKQ